MSTKKVTTNPPSEPENALANATSTVLTTDNDTDPAEVNGFDPADADFEAEVLGDDNADSDDGDTFTDADGPTNGEFIGGTNDDFDKSSDDDTDDEGKPQQPTSLADAAREAGMSREHLTDIRSTKQKLDAEKKWSIIIMQDPENPMPPVRMTINDYTYQCKRGVQIDVPQTVVANLVHSRLIAPPHPYFNQFAPKKPKEIQRAEARRAGFDVGQS